MKKVPGTPRLPSPAPIVALIVGVACVLLLSAMAAPLVLAQGKQPVKVTFWHAMGGSRQKLLQAMFQDFSRENPDVVVEDRLFKGYNELNEGILSSVAQHAPPDVGQVYENWTTQLIEVNAIVPVEEFVKGADGLSKESLADILPPFLRANTYRGTLWTLPFNKSLYVMYCNMDAFAQAGIQPPKTWDEFAQAARKLTAVQDGKTRYGFSYRMNVDMFSILVMAFGGDLLDGRNAAPAFQGPAGRKAASFLVDLVQKDRAAANSFEDAQDFVSGRSCMYIETTTKKSWFEKEAKFRFDVLPLPTGTRKPYLFAGTNIAMFRTDAARQNASWRLMKFLLRKDNQVRWAMPTGYVPVRRSAIDSPEYQAFLKKDPRNSVPVKMVSDSIAQNPPAPAWQIIRGMLDDRLFMAVAGKLPVSEALDGVALNAERLMKASNTP